MSWKETDKELEKIKFIRDWEKRIYTFKELCRAYEVSRKTGYKWLSRFFVEGMNGLKERSHKRHNHPNETPRTIQKKLIDLKYRFPYWGPEKLRDWLLINERNSVWPAASTIGDILKKYGLVKGRRKKLRVPAHTEPLRACQKSNDVWSADFKGHFRLGTGEYCYPLTISDNYSRFLLCCQGLKSTATDPVILYFKNVFEEYGLPDAIRTDNGHPFAGKNIGGFSPLAVWLLKLGIALERIDPGHPEQNPRHERMHRTLKAETAMPPKNNQSAQQRRFNTFKKEYNEERPHCALNGKRPRDVYRKSNRAFPKKVPEVSYPDYFEIRKVRTGGNIRWCGKQYYLAKFLYGEPIGMEVIDDGRAIIYFAKQKLGLIDARNDRIIRP